MCAMVEHGNGRQERRNDGHHYGDPTILAASMAGVLGVFDVL
ncbi:MAG TPA: hypothetical protein VKS79_12460 [Gemmataceae bacterium]|nr:hypothetical protein [Gemmataceae bacterium]